MVTPEQSEQTSPPASPPPAEPQPPSEPPVQTDWNHKRGYVRTFLFGILGSTFYGMYWFYVTRKLVSRELGTRDRAGWQAVGQIVPVVNLVITYWLYRDIERMRTNQNLPAGFSAKKFTGIVALPQLLVPLVIVALPQLLLPLLVFVPYITLQAAGSTDINLVAGVLGIPLLLSIIAAIYVCARIIKLLNGYWDHRSGGRADYASVSGGEVGAALPGPLLVIPLMIVLLNLVVLTFVDEGPGPPPPPPPLPRLTPGSEVTTSPSPRSNPDDADNDGLSELEETRYGSKPDNPDTDGDGFSDGKEVKGGFNPAGPGRISRGTATPSAPADETP